MFIVICDKKRISVVCAIMALLCGIGCTTNNKIKVFDPYAQSFWNKRIKKMTHQFCLDSACQKLDTLITTTYFDSIGNIVKEETKAPRQIRVMNYNENHFLVRDYSKTDIFVNLVHSYVHETDLKYIIKYTTRLPHVNWNYSQLDILTKNTDTSKLIIDNQGRITKEITSNNRTIAEYNYDGDLLISKVIYQENKIDQEVFYKYNGIVLSEILIDNKLEPVTTRYVFSNGLLQYSSKQILDYPAQFSRYKFEYY